ncbi:hypothetical protein ACIPSE_20480 [Streptomyces sp. NPDC090106]|uniref:hypothetical protein n=1 Tax=Streptomyces sp. NPDC090106 TaxID=3365946 RepID=UPI00380B3D00
MRRAEHEEPHRLELLVAQVAQALPALAADARPPVRDLVADRLADLGAVPTAHMDEEERELFLTKAPPAARPMWRLFGRRSYVRARRRLRWT